MSLLFNMLSKLVITFLPRSKHLLISWLQSPPAVIFSSVQSLSRPDAMIFVFWMLSFKPTFSLSSFTFIRVVSSAYLRLLIFLPAVLIPACVSSSPTFLMMYSANKLNKQGDNIQPWCAPFPIWNQSVVACLLVHVLLAHTWSKNSPTTCFNGVEFSLFSYYNSSNKVFLACLNLSSIILFWHSKVRSLRFSGHLISI